MRYADLNSELLTRFPELFGGYAELKAMWDSDEPGPHVLYGDVMVPYLVRLLIDNGEELSLVRAFSFMEELAVSDEQEIRDLLGVTVLEGLQGHPEARALAREYMGPSTKRLAERIADAWGR